MKKLMTLIIALLAGVATSFIYADHIPVAPQGVVEFLGRTTALLNFESFDALVELQGRLEDVGHELRFRALTLGGYYRLHRNLKVGAFYRLQQGMRHDDDWINLNPGWAWQDTRGRTEQVLILDVSPRLLLDFLPGRNWVLLLKSRYIFNTFNSQHAVLLRPGLTYFWMLDRRPLLNFSLSYDLYFPLNFGSTLIYESYPYLSVLYHLSPSVKLEVSGAYRSVNWSTSQDVKDLGDPGYSVDYRAFVLGLGVLFFFNQS